MRMSALCLIGICGEYMMENNKDYCLRVISNQVRFGCGYRTVNGKRQYLAWHGYPDRNSDYFTTAEISESEFNEINKEYPKVKSARQTEKHPIPCNMINCFCMFSDYIPLTLDDWIRLDKGRREEADNKSDA